jgi:hypothetical protein
MKRESVPRYLHMGCGEGLIARLPLAEILPVKPADTVRERRVKPKKNGGRR